MWSSSPPRRRSKTNYATNRHIIAIPYIKKWHTRQNRPLEKEEIQKRRTLHPMQYFDPNQYLPIPRLIPVGIFENNLSESLNMKIENLKNDGGSTVTELLAGCSCMNITTSSRSMGTRAMIFEQPSYIDRRKVLSDKFPFTRFRIVRNKFRVWPWSEFFGEFL